MTDTAEQLSKQLADKGKLVEAGWVALAMRALPTDASKAQLEEMRLAFFAGAQHLFRTIVGPWPADEVADLRRIKTIDAELKAFAQECDAAPDKTEGGG